MLGYDEVWTSNAQLPPPPAADQPPETLLKAAGDAVGDSQIVIDLDAASVVQVAQGTVESLTKQLEEAAEKNKPPMAKKHSRQKSIFVLPPTNVTTETGLKAHIDKELECYDEAIRDLSASAAKPAVSSTEPKIVKVTEKVVPGSSKTAGERPRKKSKLLLAMRGTSPGREGADIEMTDSSSDQDDDDVNYWGAKVPRQATVIRQGGDEDSEDPDQPPSWVSPGSVSLSDVANVKQLSSGTSNEDVTVPMEDTAR